MRELNEQVEQTLLQRRQRKLSDEWMPMKRRKTCYKNTGIR